MSKFDMLAKDFLAQEHIAIAGVSRSNDSTANYIYRTMRDKGYSVYPINPNAEEVEGDLCFSNMQAVPEKLDGAIIVTSPEVSELVVEDCIEAKVPRVWMHNNTFMPSSVSDKATAACRDNGIVVIDGGCPLMFMDFGHKCMKWILSVTGRLPSG
jgi:predicted CoA-binding protein